MPVANRRTVATIALLLLFAVPPLAEASTVRIIPTVGGQLASLWHRLTAPLVGIWATSFVPRSSPHPEPKPDDPPCPNCVKEPPGR